MTTASLYFFLPITGLLIGLLVATIGGGGGIFYVAILVGMFRISPTAAVSTSLATILPTTLAAWYGHQRMGNVIWPLAMTLSAGGAAGALIGAYAAAVLPPALWSLVFGIFLVVMGFIMLYGDVRRWLKKRHEAIEDATEHMTTTTTHTQTTVSIGSHVTALAFGWIGGSMSGMIGISGSPPILAGLRILGHSALKVVGTSNVALFFVAAAGFVGHWALGSVDWSVLLSLAVGTVTGALVAPMLLARLPQGAVETAVGPLLALLVLSLGVSLLI